MKRQKIGVLWKRKFTKDGKEIDMLSGQLDLDALRIADLSAVKMLNIAIFPNDYKKTEKHPDFNIVIGSARTAKDDDLSCTGQNNPVVPF